MPDRSVEVLRLAASSGDVLALTRLGERLLQEKTPAAYAEAVAALDRAVRSGGVEAPAIRAMTLALGIGGIQNWVAALDLLEAGSERGSASAQGQLAALAGVDEAGLSRLGRRADRWARLRAAIDLDAWSKPPPQEILSRSPRIYAYTPFVSTAVCNWLIARARGRVVPAKVFDPERLGHRFEDARNNSAFELDLSDMDVVMTMVRARIAATVAVSSAALEQPQVLHYLPGQRFEQHYDFFDPALEGHVPELARRGQRIVTFLLYLNAEFEGGETDFPLLGQRFKPPAAGALCFVNIQPSGAPDRRTLHAGLTPTKGEKWLLSQWIRERSEAARTP
jgi:prolyl 4-hydroxylase